MGREEIILQVVRRSCSNIIASGGEYFSFHTRLQRKFDKIAQLKSIFNQVCFALRKIAWMQTFQMSIKQQKIWKWMRTLVVSDKERRGENRGRCGKLGGGEKRNLTKFVQISAMLRIGCLAALNYFPISASCFCYF